MTQEQNYLEDTQGRLVPVKNIKEIDMARHELVVELAEKFKATRDELASKKLDFMGEIESFVELSAEQYGVNLGGKKGNVTLTSFDGKYKVIRAINETISFDERLQSAQELIRSCMKEWAEGANENLIALVESAFEVNKEGQVSTGRILALRRLAIDDERWQQAMTAIADSIKVDSSKAYVRMYERDKTGKYLPIVIDFSAL